MSPSQPSQISRYQIMRTLGEGGMGAVYLAQDPAIDRLVAIKLMRKGFDDGQMRERFTREAKSIGRLRHPNIVMVFDVGEYDGDPFIAMEYVEGETLSGVIRNNPDMSIVRKLQIMDALCAGLYYAHRNGVIHRDIKPPNVMVDIDGGVKILDFGIARGPASGMTQAGTVIGTLNYMAPEQLSGKPVDHRADIFAVGAVFYELLTGHQAFPGDISSGVLHQILIGQPEPVAQFVPGLHPEVVAAVERCLQKSPDARYSDLDTMRRALAALKPETWAPDVVDSTIKMPSLRPADAGPNQRVSRTPGPDTKAELLRMRRERIAQQLQDARAALGRHEFTQAMEALHQALIIDPEHPEAHLLQDRVRSEQQGHQLLEEAKSHIARGALTEAEAILDRTMAISSDMAEAAQVREALDEARRRAAEEQQRLQGIRDALARARNQIGAGQLDLAGSTLNELQQLDSANAEAQLLRRDLETARAAKARAEEDARARAAIDAARAQFANGQHDHAIKMLRDHRPAHPAVVEAIGTLDRELLEIRRRAELERRQAEERRKAEEEQRAAAERRRLDEERRKAEEARKADEARKAEERRLGEERRKAEEQQRLAQERRQAEDRRKAEEARKAEERRLAEERKRADAARKAEEQRQAELARQAREAGKARSSAPLAADLPATVLLKTTDQPQPRQAFGWGGEMVIPQDKTVVLRGRVDHPDVREDRPVGPPAPEPPIVTRRPIPPKTIAMAAAALLVVLVGVWLATKGGPGPTPTPGPAAVTSISFNLSPWGKIDSITRKSDGREMVTAELITPCVVPLEPGEYHVRASNTFYGATEFEITVVAGTSQHVQRKFDAFKPEDEARKILEGR